MTNLLNLVAESTGRNSEVASAVSSIDNRPNTAYSIDVTDVDATESEESKETKPVTASFLPPIEKPNKGLGMFKGLISDTANQ